MASNIMSLNSYDLHDVSFAGSIVKIDGIEITDFMDDANPIDFPDVTIANVGVNFNGIMARHSNPTPVIFSITVIPGSHSDRELSDLWQNSRVENCTYNTDWSKGLTCDISMANYTRQISQYHFAGGTMISGPGGPSATGEGKMLGRTYTFAFASARGG